LQGGPSRIGAKVPHIWIDTGRASLCDRCGKEFEHARELLQCITRFSLFSTDTDTGTDNFFEFIPVLVSIPVSEIDD
jgi:hypothetical protein